MRNLYFQGALEIADAKFDLLPAVCFEKRDDMDPWSLAMLEDYAFRYGSQYDSYLANESCRSTFWSTGRRGAVSFLRRGRYVLAAGGLLAPDEDKSFVLKDFLDHARTRGWHVSFVMVPESQLHVFLAFGFQATKMGEDALIHLPSYAWSGRKFEWVRRQSSFARRHGLTFEEVDHRSLGRRGWTALGAEILETSESWLATKPQSEMSGFVGTCDVESLDRRRLFVSRNAQGRLEAFLVCNPSDGGRTWAFEIYRQRADALRGVVPFMMFECIKTLKQEGAQGVSLCLVPTHGCAVRSPGDSALARTCFRLAWKVLSPVFDFQGLYHYKSRFRPTFENSYLCSSERTTIRSLLALVRVWGLFRVKPSRFISIQTRRVAQALARTTLFLWWARVFLGRKPDRAPKAGASGRLLENEHQ